jgi:hypothetical protein
MKFQIFDLYRTMPEGTVTPVHWAASKTEGSFFAVLFAPGSNAALSLV